MGVDRDSTAGSAQSGEVLFDRYRVEKKIADGGMSTVYRCVDRQTQNKVALKVLHEVYTEKEVVRERFVDEGRIQQMLSHPNIVDVYDVEQSDTLLGIVMELVDGPTLEDQLEDHGPMSTATIIEYILPVLSAIGFAHSKGVIHRDIKPSNVLLKPTGRDLVPRVMDFGVAKLVRGKDLTATGTTVGTLHYMSPEQIVGSKDIDGRADIYSLGCTIYKLCTGDVPFNASTEFALMMAQVEAPPTPPSELEPNVDRGLEAITMRCLQKRPEDRYPSVRDLTLALLDLRPNRSAGDTPISDDLLAYAMNADEVAVDRTGVIDIAALAAASSDSATPTIKEMKRVEIDDEDVSETREMRLDPAIDKKGYLGGDPTVEAALDDLSTTPLSSLEDAEHKEKTVPIVNDTAEETQPMKAVDKEVDKRNKKTQKMESTATTEFDASSKYWVEGDPSTDSREQTQPSASTLNAESDVSDDELGGATTEERRPAGRKTDSHVQMMDRLHLDAVEESAQEDDDSSTRTERVVQVALVLVLLALIGVTAAILLDYL
jgi:serine/threonine protein kinase